MIRRLRLAALSSLLLLPAVGVPAVAQSVRATVDRPEVSVEDRIVLQVTVEGSRSAQPRLPSLPDFDVDRGGQSSQMQIVNGKVSSSVVYTFALYPRKPGRFRIGPVSAEVDGEMYSSEPFEIRVLAAEERPRAPRELFLTAKVSDEQPFVGQQVVYTWRFYRRVRITKAELEPQEFGDFLVEDLGEVRNYETVVDGQEYAVSEVRKAIFPQKEGKVVIPGSRLNLAVTVRNRRGRSGLMDEFFGGVSTEAEVLRTAPIELTVRPLPAPPAGFGGLVGKFEIAADLSKAELAVGESATLEVTVSGAGNVRLLAPPELPELPAFKLYSDRPTSQVSTAGDKLTGSKSFRTALVPLAAGEHRIPPLPLVYFDPDGERYRTTTTPEFTLTVRPAEGQEELRLTESVAPTTGKVAVRILADDILPIRRSLDGVRSGGLSAGWLGMLGFALPPMLFAALWAARRRDRQSERELLRRRRRKALERSLSVLAQEADSDASSAGAVARAIASFIGDKLGVEGGALTTEQIVEILDSHSVSSELTARVRTLLARVEEARFGAGDGASANRSEAEDALRQLDREWEAKR